jgi:hypothetical protein
MPPDTLYATRQIRLLRRCDEDDTDQAFEWRGALPAALMFERVRVLHHDHLEALAQRAAGQLPDGVMARGSEDDQLGWLPPVGGLPLR